MTGCRFYGVTLGVGKAVVGVYLPKGFEVYTPFRREREREKKREIHLCRL